MKNAKLPFLDLSVNSYSKFSFLSSREMEKGGYDYYDIERSDKNAKVFVMINNIPTTASQALAQCMETDATKLTKAFKDLSFETYKAGQVVENFMSAGNRYSYLFTTKLHTMLIFEFVPS
jgi:hypothetical protein